MLDNFVEFYVGFFTIITVKWMSFVQKVYNLLEMAKRNRTMLAVLTFHGVIFSSTGETSRAIVIILCPSVCLSMVFFWRKKFLSANLIEKKILSLKWADKNILLALCALKNIVFVEKK